MTTSSTARRFGRGRLVAVQTGCGLLVAALAPGGRWGYALAAAGFLVLAGALARHQGAYVDRLLLRRLRGDGLAPPPRPAAPAPDRDEPAAPTPGAGESGSPEPGAGKPGGEPEEDDLGLAHTVLPVLDVTEVADRNLPATAPGLGVLSDGRGCAAVLAFPAGTVPDVPAALVADWLATDPARPAAAQLLVEQFGLPSWDLHYGYRPSVAYRQLPGGPPPVAVRSWLVARYETFAAPEAAERRGGGTTGARAATAAATARLRARLAASGAPTTPLGAAELRDLLRQVGDPAREGRATPTSWAGIDATHCALAAPLDSPAAWPRLWQDLAGCAVDRVVAATTLTRDGTGLRALTAVRLVSRLARQAACERDRLLRAGILPDTPTDQRAGLLATLPVAHPFRSLVETTGIATLGAPR